MDMSDTSTTPGKEKWLEIQAWGTLYVDGRCTEHESASKTVEDLAGVDSGCIIEFEGQYFYNVYLLSRTPESVTVKVGKSTATLHCGESLKVIMPLSYAYAETEVKLLGQTQLEASKARQQEKRRKEAQRRARQLAPFDPDNYDYYDDESRRKDYVKALFDAMKAAHTPEAWRQACDRAWEMRRVVRCRESIEIADYCYYPAHGRVDTDEALRWYRHAEQIIPGVHSVNDPRPVELNLLYENLVRLLYIKGREAEAEEYYSKALGIKGCESVECPHLEYVHDVLGWDISPERIARLIDKQNYAAVNTALVLTYPLTFDELYALTPEARQRMEQTCKRLVEAFNGSCQKPYGAVAYPAFIAWLADSPDYFDGSLFENLSNGAHHDDFYCLLYLGILNLYLAFGSMGLDTDEERKENFKILRDAALKNLKACADRGNALACRFYAVALESLGPRSPLLSRYNEYYNRLDMTRSSEQRPADHPDC